MTNFIAISYDKRTKWILEKLDSSKPMNPAKEYVYSTLCSTTPEDSYISFHQRLKNNPHNKENTFQSIQEWRLSSVLINQISRLRSFLKDSSVNIPLVILSVFIDEIDIDNLIKYLSELNVIFKGKDGNFDIYVILFAYDFENPEDVSKQPVSGLLEKYQTILNECRFQTPIRNIYIDNQDLNGASTCLFKDGHNYTLPRMVWDLMALLSNSNVQCQGRSALQSSSNFTGIGYGEAMYVYDDVKYVLTRSLEIDILKEQLDGSIIPNLSSREESDLCDFERYPFGLQNRYNILYEIYEKIDFKKRIESYPNSSDFRIDSIVKQLSGVLSEYMQKKQDRTVIVEEQECSAEFKELKVKDEILERIPGVILRENIYESYNGHLSQTPDINSQFNQMCREYEKNIQIILSSEFRHFCEDRFVKNKNDDSVIQPVCYGLWNRIKKFFSFSINRSGVLENSNSEYSNTEEYSIYNNLIDQLRKEVSIQNSYNLLKLKIKKIKDLIREKQNEINSFKLTVHLKSCYPLIDLEKLKKYHVKIYRKIIEEINATFESERKNNSNICIDTLIIEKIKESVEKYRFISWTAPFNFIINVNEEFPSLLESIANQSCPFINFSDSSAIKKNNIDILLLSDCPDIERINSKEQDQEKTYRNTQILEALESKVIMFRIIKLDESEICLLNNSSEEEGLEL